ncbi:MAG: TIGR02117 family protein [bacterium]|nr:TIGR02117 family protein [bacterium]
MLWRILSKTGLIYCGRAFEAFSAAAFAFVLIAFYGEAIPTGDMPKDGDHYLYVRSNGIHTELILPTSNGTVDWMETIAREDFGENISTEYLVFGWGDKGFYMNTPEWSDLTAKTASSALLVPTSTAMHVGFEPAPVENDDCIKIYVTKKQYLKITDYVHRSFLLKDDKVQLIPGKSYGPNDNFYEANSSYHLFRTCNTWTSNALKEAGVRTSVLAVFPNGVMGHFRK